MSCENALIYLDYHATTPLDPRVREAMLNALDSFGNPSSDHCFGDRADRLVRQGRKQVAQLINAPQASVYFTSGTTESINLVLQGYARQQFKGQPLRYGVLPLEHKAVLDTCRALGEQGLVQTHYFAVDDCGRLDLAAVEAELEAGLDLLVVMGANNEIGTVYPVQALAELAGRYGVPYFCDASQYAGKQPLDFKGWGLGFVALTGHKMYGPQGCGALFVRSDLSLQPLIYGGGQQRGLRPGTYNVAGIMGLGTACALRQAEMTSDEARLASLRDQLLQRLHSGIPGLVLNGDPEQRLAGNLHLSLPGICNQALMRLVREQLAISTGSACSAGKASHVLQALGLPPERIQGAVRLGLGKFNQPEELERAADILIGAWQALQTQAA
ncbi:MAG: cysteine desulfurase [Candidatus Sericytochromatia bacterium]|nr:cysteine desulfurase [Candidatus Sericytochromatia bacterium]